MSVPVPPSGLSNPDHRVRLRAIHALVEVHPAQAGQWLRPLLRDREAPVRSAAIVALGELRDQDAFAALVDCLTAPTHHERANAVGALVALGNPRMRAPLLAVLNSEPDWSVRVALIKALTSFRDDDSVIAVLIGTLTDRDDEVRASAAIALARLRATSALPALRHVAATDTNHETTFNGLVVTVSQVARWAIAAIEDAEPWPWLDWPD